MDKGMDKGMDKMMKDESMGMNMDDVELTLRRFATEQNDQALMKLLTSMFPETAAAKVAHEMNPQDSKEDTTEGE